MFTVFLSHVTLMAAAFRSVPAYKSLQKLAWAMIFIGPMAAGFDAVENLVSFILLANPQDFAKWLVYPYSGFASIKFVIFGLTYLWAIAAIVIGSLYFLISSLFNQPGKCV